MVLQDVPFQFCVFPAPVLELELAICPKSLASQYWRMYQVTIYIGVLTATAASLFLGQMVF